MGFWLTVALWAVLFVAGELLRPKPKLSHRKPGQVPPPSAEEGNSLPVVFGTVKAAINVTWFGTTRVDQIIRKVRTGIFSSAPQVMGHFYHVPMQMTICHGPVDVLEDIHFGDYRLTAHSATATDPALPVWRDDHPLGAELVVDAETLFGGEEFEGGISGELAFYFGTEDQPVDSYLAATSEGWAGRLPLPGVCHAVSRALYFGLSPSIKPMWFVVGRFPKCLLDDDEVANLNGDANPAEVIYEILTNYIWGLNVPANVIDIVQFIDVAYALQEEAFGISFVIDSQTSGEEAIQDVLRTIDGVIYTDPTSGLIGIRLVRADYVEADLPVLTPSQYSELEFSRGSWKETINEIKLEYTNRAGNFTPGVAQAQNLASVQATGDVNSETYEMPGINHPEIAQKVVERINRAVSVPLAKASFDVNRTASRLKKGDPFILQNVELGIDGLVMRVTRINYGSLHSGKVHVDAVEDVFDTTGLAYAPPPVGSSGYSDDPTLVPQPVVRQDAWEAPYFMVGADQKITVAGSRPSGVYSEYEVWAKEGADPYAEVGASPDMVPTGLLETYYIPTTEARDPSGFIVTSTRDVDQLASTDETGLFAGDNLAKIDDEIIAWKTIEHLSGNRYLISDVVRGVMDTVPGEHAPLATVFFFSLGGVTFPAATSLTDGETWDVKLKPINANGSLDLADADAMSVEVVSRSLAPSPPGNVELNGLAYHEWPFAFLTPDDADVTWSHRNRTEQGQVTLTQQDEAGAYTLEGTYTVEVDLLTVALDGTITRFPQAHRTVTGLTGTAFTYTLAERQADDADESKFVEIRITPVNGALEGTTRTLPLFLMEP